MFRDPQAPMPAHRGWSYSLSPPRTAPAVSYPDPFPAVSSDQAGDAATSPASFFVCHFSVILRVPVDVATAKDTGKLTTDYGPSPLSPVGTRATPVPTRRAGDQVRPVDRPGGHHALKAEPINKSGRALGIRESPVKRACMTHSRKAGRCRSVPGH